MDIELEKLKKLEHTLCDAIDILRDWQVEEVRPEENKNWIVFLARAKNGERYLTTCCEDRWEFVQKDYGAKTKLFIGTKSEVVKWCYSRQKFAEVIKAWEDGKTIQVYETLFKKWSDCAETLEWYTDCEYRVKPDCPCEDGIDSKACAGCEQSEDGKPHPFENYHCYGCDKSSKKKYRPYESSAEMIADFIDRFKVNCPSYCEPLIWVKNKVTDARHLVISFVPDTNDGDYVVLFDYICDLDELFDEYTYLDGSPCGMEAKE